MCFTINTSSAKVHHNFRMNEREEKGGQDDESSRVVVLNINDVSSINNSRIIGIMLVTSVWVEIDVDLHWMDRRTADLVSQADSNQPFVACLLSICIFLIRSLMVSRRRSIQAFF